MFFTDGAYFIFLIAVFFAYWAVAARAGWRIIFLVAANTLFYWQVGGRGWLLLAAISVVDFTTARLMSRCEGRRRRRLLVLVSLTSDLGALCLFKYADFFMESGAGALSLVGIKITPAALHLAVPIGISFFIFQSLAYVIDVYRRDAAPAESYLDYLAFATFFPTIIAGPILRARQLLPALRRPVVLTAAAGGEALFLIAVGLIKKIAVADYLGANLVARVFDFPERFSAIEVLAAVYGYAVEIYADFSGYSDIAIGSALLLGFRLPANFNAPYRAKDLPDFWRRWHISLSTWLRDYVFFVAVGPRARRNAALYCGMVVTMLIGGLWHGATWTFVFWGLLHGLGLVAVRALDGFRKRLAVKPSRAPWAEALAVMATFHFVCFTWIFFRAETIERAGALVRQVFTFTTDTANLAPPTVMIIALALVAHWMPDAAFERARESFIRLPAAAQGCLLFALAVGLYFVASSDVVPFIYSRF